MSGKFVVFIYLILMVICVKLSSTNYVTNDVMDIFNKMYRNLKHELIFDDDDADVQFIIYTRENSTGIKMNLNRTDELKTSTVSSTKTTKVIIHGWKDYYDSNWILNFRQEYITADDYNIIVVYWDDISSGTLYYNVAWEVEQVGEKVGILLDLLQSKNYIDLKNVHIIGHSLGAHVAGFAGKYLSGKIGRITALDPASPNFKDGNCDKRLDKNDAKFVDVIHTCIDLTGFELPIGHVDVYPNGGACHQPGCSWALQNTCGHYKSYIYMEESIKNPNAFIATKCSCWEDYIDGKCRNNEKISMGENTRSHSRGLFFLHTNEESPHGKTIFTYKVFICKKQ